MRFIETRLPGVFVVELERAEDERGFFARSFCRREFEQHGLNPNIVQCSISFNRARGTLRGMHYQAVPHEEAKLVRCTRGAVYDVVVDLRLDSPTSKQWIAVELTAENRRLVYIPERCAHGFQTLEDVSDIFYQVSEFYSPEASRGFRYDDPAFHIQWPMEPTIISERDLRFPDYGALP